MKHSNCNHCGKQFRIYDYRRSQYCSNKCYLAARWGSDNCLICGKPNKSKSLRYCSDKCQHQANKESEVRSKGKKAQYYKDYKAKLFDFLGNKCQLCGFDNIIALDIHHPKNQEKGWKHNQNRWVRYWKERYSIQLVCANCHRIIHHSPQET